MPCTWTSREGKVVLQSQEVPPAAGTCTPQGRAKRGGQLKRVEDLWEKGMGLSRAEIPGGDQDRCDLSLCSKDVQRMPLPVLTVPQCPQCAVIGGPEQQT